MNITVNYVVLGTLLGVAILELQMHFHFRNSIGPAYPDASVYTDVITSAPYPLNSILLVLVALGVSNFILRAVEFASAPDILLCLLGSFGLAGFVSATYGLVGPKSMISTHTTMDPGVLFLPKILAILYLSALLFLSYLSAKNEEQLTKPDQSRGSKELDALRKELEDRQARFRSKSSNSSNHHP